MVTCPGCGIKFEPPLRSTGEYSQNHHINGHCQQIAKELGMDYDEVKVLIKWKSVAFGYPPPREIRIGEYVYALFKSEADATKAEGSALIEGAHLLADENRIRLVEINE